MGAQKKSAPAPRGGPFGPPASGKRGGRRKGGTGGGLEEAVRHCRWIAVDLNAEGFGLVVSGPAAERAFVPVFDSDFPLASPYLSAFLDVHDGDLVRQVRASSVPLWWCAEGAAATHPLAALPWAVHLAPHGGVTPGIAFPCYPERGPPGLIAFWGSGLLLTADALFSIHARCFALFEAVSLLRAEGVAKLPQMSKRELECLALTAAGGTSEEIAAALDLSAHTTNQHLSLAGQKLNAVNRVHAVAKALRLGIID